MFGAIGQGKYQLPVWLDIYLTNQFTPPLLRELRLFFPDFKYALEGASDFILAQKRRITIFTVFVPLIAVPNIISFGIAAVMPDLMAVEPAAIRTNELVAERTNNPSSESNGCTASSAADTKTTCTSSTGHAVANAANIGNGYAKITYLGTSI